jgi:anti-anti-sigma factor
MSESGAPQPLNPAALQDLADIRQDILDALPSGVVVYEEVAPGSFRFIAANTYVFAVSRFTPADYGRLLTDLFPPEEAERQTINLQTCIAQQAPVEREERHDLPNGTLWLRSSYRALPRRPGAPQRVMIVGENITAQKRVEQARADQESLIEQQAMQLAELSTPLLAISDTTMVMPLVGAIDSRRIQQIMEALLTGVAKQGATHVILDITGVPIVDTQVANALLSAAQAVTLLGAQTVLTGIRPEVAQTLVGLGANLSSIVTRGTLQDGIGYAFQSDARRERLNRGR